MGVHRPASVLPDPCQLHRHRNGCKVAPPPCRGSARARARVVGQAVCGGAVLLKTPV